MRCKIIAHSTIPLSCKDSCQIASGLLSRSAGGIVILTESTNEWSYTDSELGDYDDLIIGVLENWFIAIGERSSTFLIGDKYISVPLAARGVVSRLRISGYDPGGLERVNFFEIDEESCLIETEVGFWRFSRSKGIMWSIIHEDLTCRINKVKQDGVLTYNEDGKAIFSVKDGTRIL